MYKTIYKFSDLAVRAAISTSLLTACQADLLNSVDNKIYVLAVVPS